MALSSGTRLGPYEVLSPLGAGGMGDLGDLFGSIKGVKPGSKNNKLVIDQVQP